MTILSIWWQNRVAQKKQGLAQKKQGLAQEIWGLAQEIWGLAQEIWGLAQKKTGVGTNFVSTQDILGMLSLLLFKERQNEAKQLRWAENKFNLCFGQDYLDISSLGKKNMTHGQTMFRYQNPKLRLDSQALLSCIT